MTQKKTVATKNGDKPAKLGLETIVREYLQIAMLPPEKEPKRQRDQRDNDMIILGYNQAQEALRHILEVHGRTPKLRELAEVRAEGQQKPMIIGGGTRVWVAN